MPGTRRGFRQDCPAGGAARWDWRSIRWWAPGRVRRLHAPGDALRTGRNARAEIAFLDGTITRLAAHSQLRLAGKP
ncbi:MAG: hypothetical protein H7338_23070 [Candidatus Sericytochromatia bacterium]|nr:hypothetical protein [Candidatus Sericytochromatia bacterium]